MRRIAPADDRADDTTGEVTGDLARSPETSAGDVTRLLLDAQAGDPRALDELLPLVYGELRRAAERQLRRERADHTLQPTALVHEAYLKLVQHQQVPWQGRAHFFGIAARSMRQILVDHARRRMAGKRGGGAVETTLGDAAEALALPPEELLSLDAALARLDQLEPRLHRVVELRFFGGLTEEEIAHLSGVSQRTVQRDWLKARAWLYKELYGGPR
jgi:RNA polymerase sigma factor (TIGR02999 family)